MSRNIARINNYFNRIEAQKDWQAQVQRAENMGRLDLVGKHGPKRKAWDEMGHVSLDKHMVALRSALDAAQQGRTTE